MAENNLSSGTGRNDWFSMSDDETQNGGNELERGNLDDAQGSPSRVATNETTSPVDDDSEEENNEENVEEEETIRKKRGRPPKKGKGEAELKKEIKSLKSKLSTLEREKKSLATSSTKAQTKVSELNDENERLAEKLSVIEEKLDERGNEIISIQDENEKLNKKVSESEKKFTEKEREYEKVVREKGRLGGEGVADLKKEIKNLKAKLVSVEKEKEEKGNELASVSDENSELYDKLSKVEKELEDMRNEKSDEGNMKEEIKNLNSKITSMEREKKSLSTRLNNKINSVNKDRDKINNELTSVRSELEENKEQLEGVKSDLEEKKNDNTKLQSQVTEMKKRLEEKGCEIRNINSENEKIVEKLSIVEDKLEEKEGEVNDLLEKLADCHGEIDMSICAATPEILFIMDNTKTKLKENLPNIPAKWNCSSEFQTVAELYQAVNGEEDLASIIKFDKIVLFIGTQDIVNNTQINKVTRMMSDIVKTLKNDIPVAILHIPPVNLPGCRSDASIFNYRLDKLSGENVQVIKVTDLNQMLMNQTVMSDGFTLTKEAADKYRDSIMKELTIPECKTPSNIPDQANVNPVDIDERETITEFMQLDDDYFGLVVGRLGSTVKKLHKNHKIQIKLGLYQEQKYIDSVKHTYDTDGLLITGSRKNIKGAKTEILKITNASEKGKENASEPKQKKVKV